MFKRFSIALFVIVSALFSWFFQATRPVSNTPSSGVEFEIKPGWGVDRIGQELSSAKLIRSRTAFKITVITLGISNKIQAGFFRLSPNMGITQIAQSLVHASKKTVRVTIPEGLRRQEIAQIFADSFKNSEESQFSTAEFILLSEGKEGQLFPDTYNFDPKASTSAVVKRLTDKYNSVIKELKIPAADQDTITILASLLEREAAKAEEMPEIAGVIKNRLQENWPLQIDATVQYAVANSICRKVECDWWPKNLSKSDLQIKSPYNTYLNQGLPPRPISNPGKAALQAASTPRKTTAWFYLHDQKGNIHFADTLSDHNLNVCRYLQKDCPD